MGLSHGNFPWERGLQCTPFLGPLDGNENNKMAKNENARVMFCKQNKKMAPATENEMFVLFFDIILLCVVAILKKRRKRCRKAKDYNKKGLYQIFLDADDKLFGKLVRLNREEFNDVLKQISPLIANGHHRAIPPDLKLLVTLQ